MVDKATEKFIVKYNLVDIETSIKIISLNVYIWCAFLNPGSFEKCVCATFLQNYILLLPARFATLSK